jgi:hypothetical protein
VSPRHCSASHIARVFWKIDYYDTTMTKGREDPTDPTQTIAF